METQTEINKRPSLFEDIIKMILDTAKEARYEAVNPLNYGPAFFGKDGSLLPAEEIAKAHPKRWGGIRDVEDEGSGERIGYDNRVPRKYPRDIVYVSVDQISRHYGGHEEGGWWYDAGHAVEQIPVLVRYKLVDGTTVIDDEPWIDDEERAALEEIAILWEVEYDFNSNHQSSMRPSDFDYWLRASLEPTKVWSDYRPYR